MRKPGLMFLAGSALCIAVAAASAASAETMGTLRVPPAGTGYVPSIPGGVIPPFIEDKPKAVYKKKKTVKKTEEKPMDSGSTAAPVSEVMTPAELPSPTPAPVVTAPVPMEAPAASAPAPSNTGAALTPVTNAPAVMPAAMEAPPQPSSTDGAPAPLLEPVFDNPVTTNSETVPLPAPATPAQ